MKLSHAIHPAPDSIPLRPTPPAPFVKERLAGMHPAYFALVMATGIVAVGGHLLGLEQVAWLLSRLNWIAYPVLWGLLLLRLILFPRRVWADCTSHQRSHGFFTIVASTAVFGVQSQLLHGNLQAATAFWWLTLALWMVATYGIFALLTARTGKPTLGTGINGGWLLSIVATQSVVVLGCVAGAGMLGSRDLSLYMLLCFWLCGGVLYLWVISLIFYRYLFFEFSPGDLMPPYWINMGAVAISTLAGALLCMAAGDSPLLAPMLPFMKGITLVYWATATWWIPMLVVLGIWRHQIRKFPIGYDPLYWGLVFPLGMYSVCTFRLGQVLDTAFLYPIAKVFIFAAVLAWSMTFLGLIRRLLFSLALGVHHLQAMRRHASVLPSPSSNQEIPSHEYCTCPNRS